MQHGWAVLMQVSNPVERAKKYLAPDAKMPASGNFLYFFLVK